MGNSASFHKRNSAQKAPSWYVVGRKGGYQRQSESKPKREPKFRYSSPQGIRPIDNRQDKTSAARWV